MHRHLAKITTALGVIFVSAVLFGCSEGGSSASGGSASSSGATTGGGSSEKGSVYAGLPLSISSNGNMYTIKDLLITEDGSGNTVVTSSASGFDVLPFRNGSMVIPVYCSVIENGTETQFVSISTGGDSVDFIFDAKLDPDIVVFYPQDDTGNRTEVKVK